jgi:hypothetical protein
LLEQAVQETYGLELGDMLLNVDLAIATYRHAVSTTIPEMTVIAWRDKHDEIVERTPEATQKSFVYALTRQDYEKEFGTGYRKPSVFARTLGFILKILPKVGPLKPLAFEPLTADAEHLFIESGRLAQARYETLLQALRARRLALPNTDFDTGKAPTPGANRLTTRPTPPCSANWRTTRTSNRRWRSEGTSTTSSKRHRACTVPSSHRARSQ